ncbi:putative bicarbonate transporter, IctB family, partial [Synechococcus lacustris]
MSSSPSIPWLLRWQGLWQGERNASRLLPFLPQLAGGLLTALLLLLPLADRGGLGLLITACGLFWLIWGLATPASAKPLGAVNGWLLAYLALALLATGFSPVPAAAAKGLFKLLSYLGVYALISRLLNEAPRWWDRLLGALLLGELITAVIGLRQLYGDTTELARWADPNSIADGTQRIYSTLENPNLLAGYLLPILPLALVALLRWRSPWLRLFALSSLGLGSVAMLLTYSRGGWIGMALALSAMGMLLLLRLSKHLAKPLRRWLPPLLIGLVVVGLLVAAVKIEPLRVRLLSMAAGREDSSNNF